MSELRSFIEVDPDISMRRQCELIGVVRSSLYYEAKGESEENLAIMRLMDEHHLDYPTYGVLQMQDFLGDQGYIVNDKRVRRLLRKMNIRAIYPGPNLSRLGKAKYIRPYLLRHLDIVRPNQVWAIDITYIAIRKGFMYLTAIIDVYSRFVVGWDISNSLDAESCLKVLKMALQVYGLPEIINSDQGSQFTCALWIEYLTSLNVKISMDGQGRALDNIFIERLWRTVKQDYVYLHPANDGTELYQGMHKFFARYNYNKKHQGIGRRTPAELYHSAA